VVGDWRRLHVEELITCTLHQMGIMEILWIGVNWIRLAVASSCEHGNEHSHLIKGREFFD
jgi:hypothetical protein